MAEIPTAPSRRTPWRWVPSLYFAEGLPYVIVMIVSVIMYKRLGISNTDIALYTSLLYLPWVIKPFWSPVVDVIRTKRFWTVAMQLLVGAGLAGVALTLPLPGFFKATLAFLWLLAFSSATHDIAADGFYMLALSERDQAWYVGIRSTFYRAAMITGQGLLIILAGFLESATGLPPVEFEVTAGGEAVATAPEAGVTSEVTAEDGDVRLVPTTTALGVPIEGRAAADVDSLIAQARAANLAGGFVAPPQAAVEADPGWWSRSVGAWWGRSVSGLLGAWITRTFARPVPDAPAVAGNVGVVGLRLSAPLEAGETAVVNLRQSDGDKSIKLVEGERLEFTAANWDQPAQIVYQLDPKIDRPTTATFEALSGNIQLAWSLTFFVLAGLMVGLMAWHQVALPRPASDRPTLEAGAAAGLGKYLVFLLLFIPTLLLLLVPMVVTGMVAPRNRIRWGEVFRKLPFSDSPFAQTIVSFFLKPEIGLVVAFIVFYRFAEAQLGKMASPFLLDTAEAGGLALTTGEVGFVYGTVGVACLVIGGIVGGIVAARDGLKKWLWPMVIAINLPNAVYIFLSLARPDSFLVVNAAVAIEQFGYGFGFAAFLLYLIYASEGEHKTAHYAICTGLMALGMMLPGAISGWLQELIGYDQFFIWVMIATIPSFVVAALIRVDPEFGKRETPAVTPNEAQTGPELETDVDGPPPDRGAPR